MDLHTANSPRRRWLPVVEIAALVLIAGVSMLVRWWVG